MCRCVIPTRGRLDSVVARAADSLQALFDVPLPAPGRLQRVDDPAAAVRGADWVQENLPEVLRTKLDLYAGLAPYLGPDTPLASSTSGFRPSQLGAGSAVADRIIVCHPFNPVFLLPAVEVVAGEHTRQDITERCTSVLSDIGMYPVRIEREIDAHVADRLLEALWREALGLVADGVATTAQIDELIRQGFGLRWAQMGLFETYRLAGGDAGMRHFLAQFGPALQWPWSRLTDVPELDAALVERIAAQSDAQSGDRPVAALEAERDQNLVAIMRALKALDRGVGSTLNAHERRLGGG